MHLVGVGETWRRLFAKFVLKVSGNKATDTFQDDQPCAILKAGIDGDFHGAQDILESNSSTENWGFLLVN